ncbi:hypothetical protein SDC9_140229 [bioreactor metagenome]|uniref:Uncharacterized protein n=1 Tax=bioreactor metagenome TaxID=1076179 RepID=A0A645DWV4_9ZZZZ|nr:hypothetical protein [Christensenella sp.]
MSHRSTRKSKWNLLYLVLAALILFSVFAVPKIAVSVIERSRDEIFTILPQNQG